MPSLPHDVVAAVAADAAADAGGLPVALLGDFLQPQPDQVADLQAAHHRRAHRHRAWTDAILLITGQIGQLAHPCQRVRQPRHRGARQATAPGNFKITQPRVMPFEAAQDVERARHDLDHVAVACQITGKHALFAKPFRASSHSAFPCGRRLPRVEPCELPVRAAALFRFAELYSACGII